MSTKDLEAAMIAAAAEEFPGFDWGFECNPESSSIACVCADNRTAASGRRAYSRLSIPWDWKLFEVVDNQIVCKDRNVFVQVLESAVRSTELLRREAK